MQKQIVSLVLLFGLSAHADLATKIDKLNSTLKNVGNPGNSECLDCEITGTGVVFKDNGSVMRSCVESICKNKTFSVAGSLEKVYEGAGKSNKTYDKEIQPLVSALAKEDAEDKLVTAERTLEWLKTAKDLKNPGAIRTYNLISAINNFSKFQFSMNGGRPGVDAAKSRSAFPELTDDEYARRVRIGNKVLEAFMDEAIQEKDPARVQMSYGSRFSEKVNDVIGSFPEKRKQIERDPDLAFIFKMQNFKDMASGEKLRQRFSNSSEINPESIATLNQQNSLLNLLVASTKDPEFKKMLEVDVIDIKKEAAKLGTEQLLTDRMAKQKSVLAGASKSLSKKCRVAFEMAQNALPSQKELDTYNAKIENLKNKFIERTKSWVCESSTNNYKANISSLKANLPISKEQFLTNMKSSLNNGLVDSKSNKIMRDETDKSDYRDSYYGIGVGSFRLDHNEATANSDDICEQLMTDLTPDATNYFRDSFVVGPMALKHKEGNTISNHELGHKLFYYLAAGNSCGNNSKFAKTRECLKSLHNGDEKFESEDWADLISAQVEDKDSNLACVFARQLNDEGYKDLSLKNEKETDPHSSALFRLLHVNFIKTGSVPAQCLHALSARGEQANFKNCLQPE